MCCLVTGINDVDINNEECRIFTTANYEGVF